jgi:hypothetical protein
MTAHQLLPKAVDVAICTYEFVHVSWRLMTVLAERLIKELPKALSMRRLEDFAYTVEARRLGRGKANQN